MAFIKMTYIGGKNCLMPPDFRIVRRWFVHVTGIFYAFTRSGYLLAAWSDRRMTPFIRICALVAHVVVALSSAVSASPPPWPQWPLPITAPIIEQGRRGINPPEEFGIYYSVWADAPEWFQVNSGSLPYRLDIVTVGAAATPMYPRQGPHFIETYPGGREAYYALYIAQLQWVIQQWIPMIDYNGLLILDYEWFCPWWTGHFNWHSDLGPDALDSDPLDDWRDTLRITRAGVLRNMTVEQEEAYFKQEWLSTTREFFERTVAACRAIRSGAKIGVYNQPTQLYWAWRFPDQAQNLRAGHDEVPWFWDLVDVICPSVYCFYKSIPNSETLTLGQGKDHESDYESYVRSNISESLRLAHGKPVYPYISFVYHASNRFFSIQPVNDFNMRRPFEICRESGCNGAVIWGWIQSQAQYDAQSVFIANTLVPFLAQFSQLPPVPRLNPCTPDLGSQGGLSQPDGSLDQNDFVSFVDQYFARDYHADVGKQGGLVGSDGLLDNNDFVAFINLFMNGCNTR